VTLLALPFVFGPCAPPRRRTHRNLRVAPESFFFLITGMVEKGGQPVRLNPVVVGWLPTPSWLGTIRHLFTNALVRGAEPNHAVLDVDRVMRDGRIEYSP